MSSSIPNYPQNSQMMSIQFVEECRHQSTLVNITENEDKELTGFLDSAYLDLIYLEPLKLT
ncbi:antitoxin MazE-like protein [Polynucleobacter antarcticus]|uniref:Uncharacterized protein n=1 Tax=Polynucleobacter antarcticus TaxID=1743162 RepID=A0A6M9PG34_9BURK|nr:antitoxin MazE-like protein [Polynucleobacter antarcticus]QKM61730.1 hypothetical protein DCO16_00715 [Polynucleobacter antarcticus]